MAAIKKIKNLTHHQRIDGVGYRARPGERAGKRYRRYLIRSAHDSELLPDIHLPGRILDTFAVRISQRKCDSQRTHTANQHQYDNNALPNRR